MKYKSKGIFGALCAFVFLIVSGAMLAGCGGKKLTAVKIDTESVQNTIFVGQTFDVSALVVNAVYSDETQERLTSDQYKLSGTVDTTTAGVYTIIVTYCELSDSVDITVRDANVASIKIDRASVVTKIFKGQSVDTSSLAVIATLEDGSTLTLDSSLYQIDASAIQSQTAGTYQLRAIYGTLEASIDVEVKDETTIQSIKIDDNSVETEIFARHNLDTSNIVVTATFEDGYQMVLPADAYVVDASAVDTQNAGTYDLTVSVKNTLVSDTLQIVVKQNNVMALAIAENSYASQVSLTAKNQPYDMSKVVVIASYQDGSNQEIYADNELLELTNDVQSSVVGTYTLSANFQNCRATKTVTVSKDYVIAGFFEPSFVTAYNQNSQRANTYTSQGGEGVKGFAVTGNIYVVGDDNAFVFEPTIEYLVSTSKSTTDYPIAYKVLLGGAEASSEYVVCDSSEHTLTFTKNAIDKTFTVEALPKYFGDEDIISASDKISFTFKVIDGYNVYNTAQLSVLDNVNASGKWTELKSQNGIALDANPSTVVLQNNIHITRQDIPSIHFWSEQEVSGASDYDRVLGSLKDAGTGDQTLGYIYNRRVEDGGTFTIEGNYFQINAQNLPLIVRENDSSVSASADEVITVHTKLFSFSGLTTYSNIPTLNIKNLDSYGNTQKTEEATLSGGIIFEMTQDISCNIYNCVSQRWFISWFIDGNSQIQKNQAQSIFENVNSFDAFNTLMYIWASGDVQINNCVMIGAGGPVMICDYCDSGDIEDDYVSDVVTTNSILESWVAGTEGWFVAYGATALASTIKQLDAFLTPYGKTMLDPAKQKMNLIAVYKSGRAEGLTATPVISSFKDTSCEYGLGLGSDADYAYIAKNTGIYDALYQGAYNQATSEGADDATAKAVATQYADANCASAIKTYIDNGLNMIVTDNGAVGAPGQTGWYTDSNGFNGTPDATKMATISKFMSLYLFNGMGAVFGINNAK